MRDLAEAIILAEELHRRGDTKKTLFEDVIQAGATWSHVLKRGTALRIIDTEGGANVGAIFYNAENPSERYNMPDTLKAQHTAHLTRGHVLYSDMGRILCSITADTSGWHDPLSGCSNAALTEAKYGAARYQEHWNAWHQNAMDGFVIELAKHGLSTRDMAAPVRTSLSKVAVTPVAACSSCRDTQGARVRRVTR
jgi:urea carboxylase-associated protein 2